MKKLSPLLFIATIVLAGCFKDPVQTVDWYKEHKTERLAMIEKCDANPGELMLTPDCVNSQTAENQLHVAKRGYSNLEVFNPLTGEIVKKKKGENK